MEKHQVLNGLKKAVIVSDEEDVKRWVKVGLQEGIDPLEMIQGGLKKGINEIGERFACHEMFIPEMISGAEVFKTGVELLNPELEKQSKQQEKLGKVMLGTVQGDIHDLGKNIVGLMYSISGFEVIDLGVDVPNQVFVEKVKEYQPDVLGLSSMLTNTRTKQEDVIKLLEKEGLRDNLKVIIGGAVIDEAWAKSIGADAFGEDAVDAIFKTIKLLDIKEGF